MSIKIYTGFIVKHNNPALLMKQLKKLQVEYTEFAKSKVAGIMSDETLKDHKKAIEESKFLYEQIFKASVVIYFFKDKILGTHFINNREFENRFTKLRWLKDYHYQNQTDEPDDVTKKEWNQRKKDWDFLNIPAKDGFIFELLLESDISPYYIKCWKIDNGLHVKETYG